MPAPKNPSCMRDKHPHVGTMCKFDSSVLNESPVTWMLTSLLGLCIHNWWQGRMPWGMCARRSALGCTGCLSIQRCEKTQPNIPGTIRR